MRPLELLLLASTILLVVKPWLSRGGSAFPFLLFVLLAMAAQLWLEGWRRPLLPLYLIALADILLVFVPLPGLVLAVVGVNAAGLAVAVFAAAVMRPATAFPPPTGPLAVGATELVLDDVSVDAATVAAEQAPPRVRLWYPTDQRPARLGLLGWLQQPAHLLDTDAGVAGAPPSGALGSLPLILYQPSWSGTHIDNCKLLRDLVSHGYVVALLDYPRRLPGMSETRYQEISRALEEPAYYASEQVYRQMVERSMTRVHKRALDNVRVIDVLLARRLDGVAGEVARRIDATRIAVLGYSLGGPIAVETRRIDPRVRAVVNIDGRHWGGGRSEGVPPPYLMLSEPLPLPSAADLNSPDPDLRYNSAEDYDDYTTLKKNLRRNGGLHIVVDGAAHASFTDLGLTSKLRRFAGGGDIDGPRALDITSTYIIAFFERALRGIESPLLDGDSPLYPEAHVTVYRGGSQSGADPEQPTVP